MQDLGICGIWAGFRPPESGTLLNGSKQGRDVVGFTFMKDLSGCHVESRLERAGVELGSPVRGSAALGA